jgi:hypothetical protein
VHVDARQVAEHHAAVVGGGEIRVGGGQFVRAGDHREPEALRGLAAPQRFPARHRVHHPVVGDHDGVGGRHGHAGRLVDRQRGDAIGDDPLIHQRARRVVQQHPAVRRIAGNSRNSRNSTGDSGQRHPGRVRACHPTRDDPGDLAVAAVGEHGPDLPDVVAGHDHEDLVDPRRPLERGHAVLEQRPAAQPQQLLGQRRADPLTRAAAQHHRDHPHEPDSNR